VKFLENIYLHSLAIKEPQIIDYFIPAPTLKDEVCNLHHTCTELLRS
jgi:hypothetical protein